VDLPRIVAPGEIRVMAAASSYDIRLRGSFQLVEEGLIFARTRGSEPGEHHRHAPWMTTDKSNSRSGETSS
jgi:hypothetical protein